VFAVTAVAAASVVSAGVVGYAVMVGRPTPAEIVPPATAVYAAVEPVEFAQNQGATLRGELAAGEQVLSSGAVGLVTSIEVRQGDLLEAGMVAYRVDGLGVYAYEAEMPLYRAITTGLKGWDVEVAQRFLALALGADVEIDGVYDWQTKELVNEWQKREGLPVDGVIDPARFLWIKDSLTVQTIDLRVGTPPPGLGATVIAGAAELGVVEISGPTSVEAGVPYRFILPGSPLDVAWDGAEWTVAEAQRDMLATLLGTVSEQAPDGLSGPAEIQGRLELAQPVAAASLPAGALMASDSSGKSCLWLLEDQGGWERVESVSVLGQAVSGAIVVDAVDAVGRNVLLEPQTHVEAGSCP
jgi:hypothetical protein